LVRKAHLSDVQAICEIVETFAKRGEMLHRSASDICGALRDFFVYEENGKIVGTCALQISSPEIGEVRSLAVRSGHTGRGIGRKLVAACLEEATELGIRKVFALTYKPGFFKKLDFRCVSKEVLPHKIWGDCIKCVKFPNCDENAVIIELSGKSEPKGRPV